MRNHPPRTLYIGGPTARSIEQSRFHGLGLQTGGGPSSLLNNAVSYWKLDEFSDASAPVTRVDSVVVTGNDLTDNNTTASVAAVISNGSHHIAANSEFLSHASNASLQLGDIDFGFSGWVRLTDKATTYAILGKGADEVRLDYTNGSDRFRMVITNGGTDVLSLNSFGSPTAGVWYFFAFWRDKTAALLKGSINNGTVDSVASTVAPPVAGGAFAIGGRGGTTFAINGDIDEVLFRKAIFTAGNVTSLYNAGVGLTYPFVGAP